MPDDAPEEQPSAQDTYPVGHHRNPAPPTDEMSDGDDGADLDPRAKAKITKANNEARNLRQRLKELEPLAAKAKELEDAGRSDLEKLTADRDQHLSRAEKAEAEAARLAVAIEKGLTKTQAKRLVGSTIEELAADADALLAEFQPATPTTTRTPRERLRNGAVPDGEAPPDVADVLARIPRH